MIRWIFFFDEGNVKSDVKDDAEDLRISEFVKTNPKGSLELPGDPTHLFVNLALVKCVARSIVDEAAEAAALSAEASSVEVA